MTKRKKKIDIENFTVVIYRTALNPTQVSYLGIRQSCRRFQMLPTTCRSQLSV